MYRIVTENGLDAFEEGKIYDKTTAESLWEDYNGIIEDLDGNDIRIYLEEI